MKYRLNVHGKILLISSITLSLLGVITLYFANAHLLGEHLEGMALGLCLMILTWRVFRGSAFNIRGLVYPAIVMGAVLALGLFYSAAEIKIASLDRLWGWETAFHLAEFSKFALLLCAAHFLACAYESPEKKNAHYLTLAAIVLPALSLAFRGGYTGNGLLIITLCFILLFLARVPYIYLGSMLLITFSAGLYGFTKIAGVEREISVFLDPWQYEAGGRAVQSLISLGSGGMWGSNMIYTGLRQTGTDYIFAQIGQYWGLAGACGVLLMFLVFIWAGLKIAMRQRELFNSYLAAGISCLIGLQGLFNILMVLGLFPIKGISLPFISYGRMSMIANLGALGVMLSFASEKAPQKIADIAPQKPYIEKYYNAV